MSVRSVAAEVLALGAMGVLLWGCDRGEVTEPPAQEPPAATPVKASDWVKSVNWDQRTVVTVTLTETTPGGPLSFSPANLTFEAGKPYVLRIVNPSQNIEKHYYSPDGLTDFYKAIAVRKIETPDAEYKAAYFNEVEMKLKPGGGTTLDIYFVPVLAGTYRIICTITGHRERGMVAQITITGGQGYQLDLEVATDFDAALATDARRSSSHDVWKALTDAAVVVMEQPAYTYSPKDLVLRQGAAHKITVRQQAGNVEKHYYSAPQFYKIVVLRKADDSHAEIKAPYLKAVELMNGGSTTLFVVPTKAGTYAVECTIPGHADKGMKGTIVVNAP